MNFQQNYFELFGIGQCFELDMSQLSARYRDLQRALHPDKFAAAPEQERRIALQRAAQVNTAYQVLKEPLTRARYLLSLAGIDVDNDNKTISDFEFLEQQIELREALAEIRGAASPLDELMALNDRLQQMAKAFIQQLAACFARGDQAALTEARATVDKLQFVRKLQDEAQRMEEEYI